MAFLAHFIISSHDARRYIQIFSRTATALLECGAHAQLHLGRQHLVRLAERRFGCDHRDRTLRGYGVEPLGELDEVGRGGGEHLVAPPLPVLLADLLHIPDEGGKQR